MIKNIIILALLTLSLSANTFIKEYNSILKVYVDDGIDYIGIKKDIRYNSALKSLLNYNTKFLKTKNEKLAFWINAYNFFMIDFIVRNSKKDIVNAKSMYSFTTITHTPLDQNEYIINGKKYTLQKIYRKIKNIEKSPIIETALFLPTKSGVKIRQKAYSTKNLYKELNEKAFKYYNSDRGVVIKGNSFKISLLTKKFNYLNVKRSLKFISKYNSKIKGKEFKGYLIYNKKLNIKKITKNETK